MSLAQLLVAIKYLTIFALVAWAWEGFADDKRSLLFWGTWCFSILSGAYLNYRYLIAIRRSSR